jgi:hypothetical protein
MNNNKSEKDYEALNQKLMASIVTLTGTFILIGIIIFLLFSD